MDGRTYAPFYAEESAELISMVAVPGTNAWTAVRFWKRNLPIKERQYIIDEMDRYVSTKNKTPQKWVMFPSVSDKGLSDPKGSLSGEWRLVKNEIDPPDRAEKGIYQTLRKYYLQPPGTPGDYPKSLGATDWTGIDSLTRVVGVNDFSDANRVTAGKNLFFGVMIPNVATETVKEFCAALANRPVLANPVFENQTALSGNFLYGGVRSKLEEDGSSTVTAALAQSDNFANVPNVFSDLWNEQVARMFFDNLPNYPAQPFPTVNIAAVDKPDFSAQLVPATIYAIMDAKYSEDTGLWSIVVNRRTAHPFFDQWTVPSYDGAYAIMEYANQTSAWLQNKFSGLNAGLRNECFRPPHHNEFNLFEGNIHQRPVVNKDSNTRFYHTGFWWKYIVDVKGGGSSGNKIQEVWRLTLCEAFDQNVVQGKLLFYQGDTGITGPFTAIGTGNKDPGGPPLEPWSSFRDEGHDQYRFTRVVKVELFTYDITTNYNVLSRPGGSTTPPVTISESKDPSGEA